MSVLLVIGSIRASAPVDYLKELRWSTPEDNSDSLAKSQRRGLSNSECAASMLYDSLSKSDISVEIFNCTSLFQAKDQRKLDIDYEFYSSDLDAESALSLDSLHYKSQEISDFKQKLSSASVVVLISPVYFGDKSSVANKIFHFTSDQNLLLGKIFTTITIGAKRNGGQETAAVFSMYDALSQGANIISSGPPVSQYGATLVAGDKSTIASDDYGRQLIQSVSGNITRFAALNDFWPADAKVSDLPDALFLLLDKHNSSDIHLTIHKHIQNTIGSHIELLDSTDHTIQRCIACNVCPPTKVRLSEAYTNNSYGCIFQGDDDEYSSLHSIMVRSRFVFVLGFSSRQDLITRYQAILERSRYLRRDDFMLANTVIVPVLVVSEADFTQSLIPLKIMTSFMRHNTIISKPWIFRTDAAFEHVLASNYDDSMGRNLMALARYIESGSLSTLMSYKALGYSRKNLDSTAAVRN